MGFLHYHRTQNRDVRVTRLRRQTLMRVKCAPSHNTPHPHESSIGILVLEFLNRERWRGWAPIPIRMILGVGFMVHGWAKWTRGPAAFAELLKQANVPFPFASAWLVTLLEIFGGLALLMGAFVAIVSIPLILSMLGAMFTVNIKYGFSAVKTIGLTGEGPKFGPPGYEINLLYIAGLVALILGGAGPLSIDADRKS